MKYSPASTAFFKISFLFAFLFLLVGTTAIASGGTDLWRPVKIDNIRMHGRAARQPEKFRTFRLDAAALRGYMADMPAEFSVEAQMKQVIVEIPMPDGSFAKMRIENSPVLSKELAADFPDWRAFQGYGIDDPTITGRFDWTRAGFHGYIFTSQGTVYIDPVQENDTANYYVYYKHEYGAPEDDFQCKVNAMASKAISDDDRQSAPAFSYGTAIRTYRLAIATTGQWARSTTTSTDPITVRTAALAAITTSVDRLNGIYRREIAVTLQLVNPPITNNATNIIFDDPAAQPYDNSDSEAQLTINQTTIDARVGAANYDVGHLYGTGGGGVAASPSVCSTQKAQGYSARAGFLGDPFTVDYVAHEIGHQFGGSHTYNNMDQGGACTTRSTSNAFEVASGSTIMSYVGICNIRNLQQYVDAGTPMFHIRSLTQMVANIQDPDNGGSCGTPAGVNAVPTVNAGANFTIPKLTPFTLTATGNDADPGDVPNLLYSWEEYDLAPSGSGQLGTPALTYDVDTDGILRPLFRAYSPVPTATRTFPSLQYILNPAANLPAGSNNPPLTYQNANPTGTSGSTCQAGSDCVIGESLPSVARTMNFRVAVRDIRGGIADAGMTVTTVNTPGPFQITSQNAPGGPAWNVGSTQTVTWDVVGTDTAPISAANVRITLSTDGGRTFPVTLLASTPNNGTAQVTVPNNATTQARIKVEAIGNIFFDINNVDFSIVGAAPGVMVGNGQGSEGGGPFGSPDAVGGITFTISLTSPSSQTVTVRVSTNSITATEGDDFTGIHNFDVVFPPNTLTQTVTVPILEDSTDEPDETFALDIVSVINGTVVDGEGIGTIVDNDPTVPTTRIVRVVDTTTRRGQLATVALQIDSQGNEGTINFSANFVPGTINDPFVTLGNGAPAGTSLDVNTTQLAIGRIGIKISSATPFSSGTREIAKIRFTIPPDAPIGFTPIAFGNAPIAQSVTTMSGTPLTATFQTGSVKVAPALATATLSGRVTSLLGLGMGRVTVVITDQDGVSRTALTSPFGYYRFDNVPTDKSYIVVPTTKLHNFTPRGVMVIGNVLDADFVEN